jgi:peptide/nickel transport system permease protein
MTENTHIPEMADMLDAPLAPKQSQFMLFWHQLQENRLAVLGMVIFIGFFCLAITGLLLTSGPEPILDPATIRLPDKLKPPFSKPTIMDLKTNQIPPMEIYLFGTDELGRDIFARMLQGAWVSLTVGFVAVGISVIIGIFMGGIAGFYGQCFIRISHTLSIGLLLLGSTLSLTGSLIIGIGCLLLGGIFFLLPVRSKKPPKQNTPTAFYRFLKLPILSVDAFIMRFVDIMLCFPSFFLILTVVALLPASIYNIMIIIGLTSWMGTTRFVRAEFLSLRELDFVAAAKALGVGDFRIIFRHIMPNAIAPVLVSATIGIASAILTEAGLSFLGFGVPPPHATWGNILSSGQKYVFDAPWLTFIPGIAILIVVLAFNLFGEGLRDILNPKLRERNS